MEKFLTYHVIFAFAIPTTAIVTTAVVLIVLAIILLLAVFWSGRRHRKITRYPPPSAGQKPGSPSLSQQLASLEYDISTQQPADQGHDPATPQLAAWRYDPSTQQSADWKQQSPTTLPPAQSVTGWPIIPQRESPPSKRQETVIPPPPDKTRPEVTTTYAGITPSSVGGGTPVRQSPPSARVVIRTKNGGVVREFPIAKRDTSIGRASNSDIPLSQDKLTSRRHATIRYQNGNYVLYDEQSVNGTFVNGQRLDPGSSRILHNGDHVSIGEYELTFYGYSVSSSVQGMPPAAGQYIPVSVVETTQYTPQHTFYAPEDANPAESEKLIVRSMDEDNSDHFAQQLQPTSLSEPAPPLPSLSASPSGTGTLFTSPESEPPEKSSAVSPAPTVQVPARSAAAPPSPPVSASVPKSATPLHPPEQLRFTAFHPKEVVVESWDTLLVYAHIESAIEAIHKDVQRFKAELGAAPRKISAPATQLLPRETNISIVPECKGITFNPRRITFKWLEDWHRASFRFQAKPELAGSATNGRINIFAGPLLVGTLKMPLLFAEPDASSPSQKEDAEETGQLYKQIFASYSHDDSLIVLTCRDVFKAIGYQTLIDIDSLRAGQKFSDALKRMIDVADIFQLFWSERAAKSRYVREEWEYALNLNKGEGFVRPVYWEVPMVAPPEKLAPLHFAYLPVYTFNQQQSSSGYKR